MAGPACPPTAPTWTSRGPPVSCGIAWRVERVGGGLPEFAVGPPVAVTLMPEGNERAGVAGHCAAGNVEGSSRALCDLCRVAAYCLGGDVRNLVEGR